MPAVYLLLLCILSQKDRPVKLFFQASIIRFHVGGEGSELSSSISLWILLFAPSSWRIDQGVHNSTTRLKWSWIIRSLPSATIFHFLLLFLACPNSPGTCLNIFQIFVAPICWWSVAVLILRVSIVIGPYYIA